MSKIKEAAVRCGSVFDGQQCQLPAGHSRKHGYFGTKEVLCSVQWTDGGLKRWQEEKALADKLQKDANEKVQSR